MLAAGKEDPLKAVKGFVRAPKRSGSHADEELTEMEVGGLCVAMCS